MSFEAVFSFVTKLAADPALCAEVVALEAEEDCAAAVAAFAAKQSFDFTAEEYEFLRPYALQQLRSTASHQGRARLDDPLLDHLQYPHEPRATLLGNSHASVIKLAADAANFPLRVFAFAVGPQPYVDSEAPSELSAFHPTIADAISRGDVFSAIGRSMHERLFLMQHPRKFDFVLPEHADLPMQADAEIVPWGAIRSTCANALELDLKLIALAQKTATGRFFHIMVQPPLEDDALALAMTPFTRAQVPIFDVSKATLRFKIYGVCCSITEAWCGERGIPILFPPTEALNERGFLKPHFALNTTHGNRAYGELVLGQMRQLL